VAKPIVGDVIRIRGLWAKANGYDTQSYVMDTVEGHSNSTKTCNVTDLATKQRYRFILYDNEIEVQPFLTEVYKQRGK